MLDLLFCIPVLVGCSNKVRPEGDQTPRICPRCHNVSAQPAKSRMWFELCFIPLIPMSSKHIWICSICQWSLPIQSGWEPEIPNYGPPPGQWGQDPPSGPPPNSHKPQH